MSLPEYASSMKLISEAKELIAKEQAVVEKYLEYEENYENYIAFLSKKYNPILISEYFSTFGKFYMELPAGYAKLSSWKRRDYIWKDFPKEEKADYENAKKNLLSHLSRDEAKMLNILQEKLYNLS